MNTLHGILFRNSQSLCTTALFCLLISPVMAQAANIDGCIQHAQSSDPSKSTSLYTRLGGYDAIAAVVDDLVQRLATDKSLGRFWAHRGADGISREKQLVIDFIVEKAGGPLHYGGRDMVISHKGMRISDSDWKIFMAHLDATLQKFKVPNQEKSDVTGFINGLKATMVEP